VVKQTVRRGGEVNSNHGRKGRGGMNPEISGEGEVKTKNFVKRKRRRHDL
jgi:hypothetical protein